MSGGCEWSRALAAAGTGTDQPVRCHRPVSNDCVCNLLTSGLTYSFLTLCLCPRCQIPVKAVTGRSQPV